VTSLPAWFAVPRPSAKNTNSSRYRSIFSLLTCLAVALSLFVSAQSAMAQTKTILYSFGTATGDGYFPHGRLLEDSSGNFYGTTYEGGSKGYGTVFEVSPPVSPSTTWTQTTLYTFGTGITDPENPQAGLVMDSSGNLYGISTYGGTNGYGAVFELSKVLGTWTVTILHSFTTITDDGYEPDDYEGLYMDSSGDLYGTTTAGGLHSSGTVFELSPISGGWSYSILYNFGAYTSDGNTPFGSLIADSHGNLYGTTGGGGAYGYGTVFKLASGTDTILHSFAYGTTDGAYPQAGVLMDSSGNLYGTTYEGGSSGYGIAFEVTSLGGFTVIHNFTGSGDGINPLDALVMDSSGNLYGTTWKGGAHNYGLVFELSVVGGSWTETKLYSFTGISDGTFPFVGDMIIDSSGNLYGTTGGGGSTTCNADNGCGTVFKLVP
jgi:uncharacterized repeat protein (TIGR03803 family)